MDRTLELPQFSSYVEACLLSGETDLIWSRIVHETAPHYLTTDLQLGTTDEYQTISRHLWPLLLRKLTAD